MLGAASAFDAREGLQRIQLGDVFAGIEAEIFVAHQRRDLAETIAPQKDRRRADHQMQMLGMRNQRQEGQQRKGVQPPVGARGGGAFIEGQPGQIGDHQHEESTTR